MINKIMTQISSKTLVCRLLWFNNLYTKLIYFPKYNFIKFYYLVFVAVYSQIQLILTSLKKNKKIKKIITKLTTSNKKTNPNYIQFLSLWL